MTGGVYREIVPDEKLVLAWGATGGWPELDPDRLDDSPQVTVTLAEVDGRTEMSVHVELPESMPDDGVRSGGRCSREACATRSTASQPRWHARRRWPDALARHETRLASGFREVKWGCGPTHD